jgi:uncharacterized membrane protein
VNNAAVWAWTALLSFLPISELRGAIPFAMLGEDMPWYAAYPYAAALNALVAPICWIFLSTLHRLFLNLAWYEKFFARFVERSRNKLRGGVEKWGWLGVAVFVAIPLPMTGAWTGVLGAWVLGLPKRKTMLAVILGLIVAGAIVTSVTIAIQMGNEALRMFIKKA